MLLDRERVARELGVSVATVDRMRKRGKLPWIPVGERLVKFRPQIVADLAAAREQNSDENGRRVADANGRRTGGANRKEAEPERELAPLRLLPLKGAKRFVPPSLELARAQTQTRREKGQADGP